MLCSSSFCISPLYACISVRGMIGSHQAETYQSSCASIIMHISALVTVTSVSCFAENKENADLNGYFAPKNHRSELFAQSTWLIRRIPKKSSGKFRRKNRYSVSWSVVTTSLFSMAVAISSSLLLNPPFSIMSEIFHLTPLTDRPNFSAISR